MPTEQLVKCPNCGGAGRLPLAAHLKSTLAQIPKTAYTTAHQVAANLDIESGAAHNRLVDLLGMGMVQREKLGKVWLYSLPAKPKKPASSK